MADGSTTPGFNFNNPEKDPEDTKFVLTDGDGLPFEWKQYQGLVGLPAMPNIVERLKLLPKFVAREEDTWICTYPKCGTHWIWEIASMVINGKAETIPVPKEDYFIECTDLSSLDSKPSPRVLNTHLPLDCIPKDVFTKKNKIILLIRNPKDAYVSMYYHMTGMKQKNYNGTWNGYFELIPQSIKYEKSYGNWMFYHKRFWEYAKEHTDTVLALKYEEMLKDPVSHVRKVAEFLGKPIDQKLCEAIAEKCSFEHMKKAKQTKGMAGPEGEKHAKPDEKHWRDKAHGMYRKGKVGDWKNHFTVAQSERFDALYEEQMRGSDLTVDFEAA
ncbi:sulfotransferase 1C2 [Lingula anatina]|uniref:Sulfotransferase 1C2 n=1 Tax=Lingula anatina TaxID=7574 RepID=A0A1S3J9W6_LINAN|nr:sulfotransferase 1C2 [Lingula anatina]|eukprot:XP_013407197.1 sulfotransferase 1C2 [Lingula anatina]